MAIKSAMIGNGKNHFSCKWQSNQERMETKKNTFVPNVSQISNEWKRKNPLFLQMAIKSGKNGNEKKNFCASRQSNQQWLETEKKTFVPAVSQISNEWKWKKKLLSHISMKSAMNGNGKKNFCASKRSNQQRIETEKTEFVRKFSQMSNKMRLRMLKMSPL